MRLLTGLRNDGPLTLAEHQAIHGPLPRAGRELIDAVEAAGLRGRGGANFPSAIKLRAVAERRRPVVVVNGTEGEPLRREWRTTATRRRPVVLILDVSGSMAPYSKALLLFAHSAMASGANPPSTSPSG